MSWRTDVLELALSLTIDVGYFVPRIDRGGAARRHAGLQLYRAVSTIGAHLEEAEAASSRREMAYKQSVALREAREAEYWLKCLQAHADLAADAAALRDRCGHLAAILTKSVRKLRNNTDNP